MVIKNRKNFWDIFKIVQKMTKNSFLTIFDPKWSFLIIYTLFLVWDQKFLQFWNQEKISHLFCFLKILIRAKFTFADFLSHTWFGGFSNKYLNYEYLGIVFSLVQEKVDLKTLIFWFNITIHHYKKKIFFQFFGQKSKNRPGPDLLFWLFYIRGHIQK